MQLYSVGDCMMLPYTYGKWLHIDDLNNFLCDLEDDDHVEIILNKITNLRNKINLK